MKRVIYFLILVILLIVLYQWQSSVSDTEDEFFSFIKDEKQYIEVMTSFENHPAIRHFPDTIPLNATDIEFVYEPKRMQGQCLLSC